MVRRWYQTIDIDGDNQVFEDFDRVHSAFWNEGKWNNFIKPLLPKERQTFIEIGCNAGLFLKMAIDEGFKDVIGVEGNSQIMDQAVRFREVNGGNYKLVHQLVGKNFALDDLPVADVVLMSNMHYYLPIPVFSKLVDELKSRSLRCIIVSARAKRRSGNALWDIASVRGYFRDWEELEVIESLDNPDDICPREQMYGLLYKGNLSAINVDEVYDAWSEAATHWRHRSYKLPPAIEDFFGRVLSGESFEYEDTLYYQYWRERRPRRTTKWTRKLLAYKESLAKDVQENGIKTPIYFIENGHLRDGIHRLCLAKLLGYKHILGRLI
jgi:hypothetical protein